MDVDHPSVVVVIDDAETVLRDPRAAALAVRIVADGGPAGVGLVVAAGSVDSADYANCVDLPLGLAATNAFPTHPAHLDLLEALRATPDLTDPVHRPRPPAPRQAPPTDRVHRDAWAREAHDSAAHRTTEPGPLLTPSAPLAGSSPDFRAPERRHSRVRVRTFARRRPGARRGGAG